MVFQNYAIYPHMTVRKNIGFGLRCSKLPRAEKEKRIDEIAEILGMTDLLARKPGQLSGGQRQRVAIGRAMVRDPAVFLFDEPLSNLDAQLRTQMRLEIKKLHQRVGATIVFVTHDQEEAMEVSDEIVVMNKGRVEQTGTPAEIYDHPATAFVMSFIGPVNVLPSTSHIFQSNGFEGTHSDMFLRPQDVMVATSPNGTTVPARVSRLIHLGWEIQVELSLDDGQVVTAHLTREKFDELNLEPQQRVYVKPKDAKSFPLYYSI